MKRILTIFLAFLLQALSQASEPRVAILGDSITYGGRWATSVESALRATPAFADAYIVNFGLASETVSGLSEPGHAGGKFPRPCLHERLARILDAFKPTHVLACYGMNDGIYMPLDETRQQAFQDGMTRLKKEVENRGAKLVAITAPLFEGDNPATASQGYDAVLDAQAAWLLSLKDWQVIDIRPDLRTAIAAAKKTDPQFVYAADKVHPGRQGHDFIAASVIRQLWPLWQLPGEPKVADDKALSLLGERAGILKHAWLRKTGHLRPGVPEGLPLEVAEALCHAGKNRTTQRPNILWFVVDDMSAHFSCYGESLVETPAVDKLAAEGTRFTKAHVTAPVCSAARSAMITGMYQTSIGAHHHRSGRGKLKIHLPDKVVPIPALFHKAGYFNCIGSGLPGVDHRGQPVAKDGLGKTDYNFEWDHSIYHSHDWAGRGEKPFFMQVQLHGGKMRGESSNQMRALAKRARRELGSATDPRKVTLPPYYPRDPVLLEDWAAYLDSVRLTDRHVGRVIERLEREGLLDNTLIVFMTDHGISHARGKQFLYDEGTHIPFIIRGPGVPKGGTRDDLVEHIDMAALSLAAAGIPIPEGMHGRDILARDYQPRDAAFAARDRCDETVDRIRSVRSDRFLYIRNFHPERPLLQPCVYKDGKDIIKTLRAGHAAGTLPPLSEKLLFSPTRPAEELYAYTEDRWQTTNLSGAPEHQATLTKLRDRLDQWIAETKDHGPEPMAMYDSDMNVFLEKPYPNLRENIALMKRWATEGK